MAILLDTAWQFHLMLHGSFSTHYIAISMSFNHCDFLFNQDKISDVKSMNWCKFIADFIHEAFSKNMYQKGSRLYLMASLLFVCYSFSGFFCVFTFLFYLTLFLETCVLSFLQLMYVDKLDISKVKFGNAGPPRTGLFAVSAWNNEQVKSVLTADRKSDSSYGKSQASLLSFMMLYVFFSSLLMYVSHKLLICFCFVSANGQAFHRLQLLWWNTKFLQVDGRALKPILFIVGNLSFQHRHAKEIV